MKTITLDWVTYNLTPVENKQKYIKITWGSGKKYEISAEPCINKNKTFEDETFFTHTDAVKQYELPNISEWNDMVEWNLEDFIIEFPGFYSTDGTGPRSYSAYAYFWASDTYGSNARRLYLNSSEGENLGTSNQNYGFQVRAIKR